MKRLIAAVAFLAAAGCGDYQQEIYEDIGPNETAFVVPLEGNTKAGGKFDSEQYVESMKVASKRITVPTRKLDTGRMWTDYKWIHTVLVVKVNRAAVTREWTSSDKTGTTAKDEALRLGSRDGIGFHIGCTCTGHIDESHAAKFLYNWGQKDLGTVMDANVRSFVQTALTHRFGSALLSECLTNATTYFSEVAEETKKEFLDRGVTIDFLGPQGKPHLDNPEIQAVIDQRFSSENSKLIATNQAAAQIEQNKQLVEQKQGLAQMIVITAEADAKVKVALAKGEADATRARADAEAYQITQKATAEAAGNALRARALEGEGGQRLIQLKQIEQWSGTLPGFMVSGQGGVPFLLNLPAETLKK